MKKKRQCSNCLFSEISLRGRGEKRSGLWCFIYESHRDKKQKCHSWVSKEAGGNPKLIADELRKKEQDRRIGEMKEQIIQKQAELDCVRKDLDEALRRLGQASDESRQLSKITSTLS